MERKDIVVIYHGKCPDGFGGAYAAWKKFGDAADYIPMQYSKPIPEHMDGRDIYFVDFCFDRERMDALAKVAKSITVLDHHEGIRAVAESFPGVFDTRRSGASIAWAYFHPNTALPFLFRHLENYDLFNMTDPDTKAVNAFIVLESYEFERWDEIVRTLEDPATREHILGRGRIYSEHMDGMIRLMASSADLVEFEGHTVFLSASGMQAITDFLGNELAAKHPPFAIMVRPTAEGLRVSLRSVGTFDVAELARRHGGNGHINAAAFRIPWGEPIPWKAVPKTNEDPRD